MFLTRSQRSMRTEQNGNHTVRTARGWRLIRMSKAPCWGVTQLNVSYIGEDFSGMDGKTGGCLSSARALKMAPRVIISTSLLAPDS